MQPYRGVDYYELDATLGDEERSVRDTVRALVDQEFLPRLREHFAAGTFPAGIVPHLAELGLLGPSIHGYGCPASPARSTG